MKKSGGNSAIERIVIFLTILLMCASMRLYFTWILPNFVACILCAFATIIYVSSQKKALRGVDSFALLVIVCLIYNYFENTAIPYILSFFALLCSIFVTSCTIYYPDSFKKKIYVAFDRFLKVVCAVSLVGWILYLIGVPLPHYYSDTDEFYTHEVYYVFLKGFQILDIVPRFCGLFLEPGHLASTCCIMLYINKFNFRSFSNYIYLFGVLFSLSLAGYSLLAIGLIMYNYFAGKDIAKRLFVVALILTAIVFAGLLYNGGDNPINEKILSRFEVVDGEMVGNNRTTASFDFYYEKWMKGGDLIFGNGSEFYTNKSDIDLGTASYQRFLYINGFLGAFLVLALYIGILRKKYSRQGLGLFLLVLICNMIRDYPYKELWFYLFIFGVSLFYTERNQALCNAQQQPVKKVKKIRKRCPMDLQMNPINVNDSE